MKHLKLTTAVLILVVILSGCKIQKLPATESASVSTGIIAASEQITEPATEAAKEPTVETIMSLDTPAGSHLRYFFCEDTDDYLDYYLFVPENAVAQMPLVVFLHGDGEVGRVETLESYGPIQCAREIYGENFPFIMISPCTRDYSWTNATIPETLMSLIRMVMDECSIDSERVIVTGHSRGAIGVWYLISEYGDFFSAAVPVSCGSNENLNFENMVKVPVFALAGDVGQSENNYRYAMEKLIVKIRDQKGTAYFTVLSGSGHDDTVINAYTEELFNWILEQ